MSSLLLLLTWETRESSAEREVSMDALGGEVVELSFVGLHLGDEVNEVLGFLEFVEVLSINNVAELVLNLDDQLNHIEGVKTVLLEIGFKGNLRLLGGAEVVSHDAENVLGNLVVVLEHKGILLCLSFLFPERDLATLASDSDLGCVLKAEAVEEHTLGDTYHSTVVDDGGHTEARGRGLSQSHRGHKLGEHFLFYINYLL